MFELSEGELSLRQNLIDTINIPILIGYYSDASPRYSSVSLQANLFDGPNPTGTITDYYSEIS